MFYVTVESAIPSAYRYFKNVIYSIILRGISDYSHHQISIRSYFINYLYYIISFKYSNLLHYRISNSASENLRESNFRNTYDFIRLPN